MNISQRLSKQLSPSQRRILSMNPKLIINHNALITLGKSKLSSKDRIRVKNRVSFLVGKGKITLKEINDKITDVKLIYADNKK